MIKIKISNINQIAGLKKVKYEMKDNTIICSGVDRVRNSTISCELKVGDTLVLTDRGIHSCISIENIPIKI